MASRAATLAELRALRASGKKRFDTYEVAEARQLYEEVDEEGYKKVVRGRLDQDDFVIDDNGEGYADDGREEWTDQRMYSDSDDDLPVKTKASMAALPRPLPLASCSPPHSKTQARGRQGEIGEGKQEH